MSEADSLSWLTARPIAHRGFHDESEKRLENTLAAFAAAVERGYAIECDVHLSADGVPVIFHDGELKRLTGREEKVWQLNADELKQLSVGDTEEHIPDLVQMLDLVGGRVPIVIELKGEGDQNEALVQKVLDCLTDYEGETALMSFDHRIIRVLGEKAGELPVGLTASGRTGADMEAHFSMLAHGISFCSYAVEDLPNPFVSFLRKRLSMPVISWTVRDTTGIERTHRYADQMTFEGFAP